VPLDNSKKRPRGIRFTDQGYKTLQTACEASDFSHLDDFLLDMLKGKQNRLKMDAMIRKIKVSIDEGVDRTLEGVRTLLDEYTGG
jgi:hypothetical protein